jgi:hypothetical protein
MQNLKYNRPRYRWFGSVIIKKKMLCYAKHVSDNPLVLAVSNEYEDAEEWERQVKFWHKKYRHPLRQRHTLVQCQHINILNGEIIMHKPPYNKIYIFPREQLSPLSCDEVDKLLGVDNE